MATNEATITAAAIGEAAITAAAIGEAAIGVETCTCIKQFLSIL